MNFDANNLFTCSYVIMSSWDPVAIIIITIIFYNRATYNVLETVCFKACLLN